MEGCDQKWVSWTITKTESDSEELDARLLFVGENHSAK